MQKKTKVFNEPKLRKRLRASPESLEREFSKKNSPQKISKEQLVKLNFQLHKSHIECINPKHQHTHSTLFLIKLKKLKS